MRFPKLLAFSLLFGLPALAQADVQVVGFEDVGGGLAPESAYIGADGAGGFTSDGAFFNNDYQDFGSFSAWAGWAYSNRTDNSTPGFGSLTSAFVAPGGGYRSSTYGVASLAGPELTGLPDDVYDFSYINLPDLGTPLSGLSARIANTTYTATSILQGDRFAKQFGGVSGDDPDFLKLTITGFDGLDKSGNVTGSFEFFLADYRFADNALDYVVDAWTLVDFSQILGVGTPKSLGFRIDGSDRGDFGLNTPATFAIDDLRLVTANAVPEPASLAMAAAGLAGLVLVRRRRI